MTDPEKPFSAPTSSSERYAIMDVLRGFALFGVLTANLVWLGAPDFMATEDQMTALPSAGLDDLVEFLVSLFVDDKANTLFAFLFGAGFWVMMERLEARGAGFGGIYLRRITVLCVIGFLHLFGLFAFDILHLYGMAAFVLYFCRKLPERMMFRFGLVCLIFGKPLVEWVSMWLGLDAAYEIAYSEEAALSRQAAAHAGDYIGWIGGMDWMVLYDWFASGLLVAWVFYVLGRFFIGAWVARQGWLQTASERLPMFRKALWPALLAGYMLEITAQTLWAGPDEGIFAVIPYLADLCHAAATPLIDIGYVCALVLLFHSENRRRLVQPFAPVGQMALTNYLTQSVIIMLVLTNIGPGLGLAGRAGTATYVLIAILVYAAQAVFSHYWMKSFAYGPAEWVWRTLTYGKAPAIRRARVAAPSL